MTTIGVGSAGELMLVNWSDDRAGCCVQGFGDAVSIVFRELGSRSGHKCPDIEIRAHPCSKGFLIYRAPLASGQSCSNSL